ncbi:MAG: 3'(2'),5'-bisphosphate nucleotidase CysQ, partial [Bacteroidota bacterium]|nr:3'(2'),5'-bisphosphate nucleotidase CysQ [Bacteroidota bacterium]
VLSEEGDEISFEERKNWNTFWVVDPLDGTKEFIKKNGEFTVNIALVKDNTPILGVIYVPVDKTLYFSSLEKGSYKAENITEYTSFTEIEKASLLLPLKYDNRNYTIVASRSHLNEETKKIIAEKEKQLGNVKILSVGSSLKLCMIAENRADIYPRFGPTMEWDIAAGHAIVKYAGGSIIDHTTNLELLYNKENLRNPYFTAKNNLL